MSTLADELSPRRGRPRKFARPSRAVTLTLPEDVIAVLESMDADLSRAVVRLAQPELARLPHPPAELATFGDRAVIVVNPTRTLEERTGAMLVPLSDGRALIAFNESISVSGLELLIRDALDDKNLPEEDARIFAAIGRLLKEARQSDSVALAERHIIVLEHSSRPRRRTPGEPKAGPAGHARH